MGRDTGAVVVLVRGDVELASWTLRRTARLDLAVVDQLARLQLAARRLGCSVRLRAADPGLLALLDLVGLAEVLVGDGDRSGEASGEAEGGEEAGVEEVVVPDDPVS